MKNIALFVLSFVASIVQSNICTAQYGNITTIAGNGTMGSTGDGGPATLAQLAQPSRIVISASGNIYVVQRTNHRIRKITPLGTISTITHGAGGYGGDGGPATAALLWLPTDVAIDGSDNIYIADQGNNRIRKIDASGIITTIAGTGVNGYSGDGGPAIAAQFSSPWGVTVDNYGNVYIADRGNNRVRKVNTAGIITTIAGNGTAGFLGDGGLATLAQLNIPVSVAVDDMGSVYISDNSFRIRKVNTIGIISTIAGTGVGTYSGDGGPASLATINPSHISLDKSGNLFLPGISPTVHYVRKVTTDGIINTIAGAGGYGYVGDGGPASFAQLNFPKSANVDIFGNVYVGDEANNRVRKIDRTPDYFSDSFSVCVNTNCSGTDFAILTNSFYSGATMRTYFGDGLQASSPVLAGYGSGYATFSHQYNSSGTYSVKHVLMHGTVAVDSISYMHHFRFCNTLEANFYYDGNSDCVLDAGSEHGIYLPVTTEIDSNGVTVASISATSGFRYKAYGVPGDIYTMHITSHAPGLSTTCPTSGILSDTLQPYVHAINTFGFNCSSLPGFDMVEYATNRAGPQRFRGDIIVQNTYCTPQSATITLNVSPKYTYWGAFPLPTTISGNTITWDVSSLSVSSPQEYIRVFMKAPFGVSYLPGDTVNSSIVTTPITGDLNPSNNVIYRVDTIRSAYDPNYIEVMPEGYIPSGTELTYTIGFENTGNDTAHNIFVMDTLSGYLDLSTFTMLTASATMKLSIINSVVKFDFPDIMLPDSSHHGLCHGFFSYKIKTRTGLPNGTVIPNRVGIFFDTNPVVMTNTVYDIIGIPITLNVKGMEESGISIYPNPATDELVINSAGSVISSYNITNTMGQVLIQSQDASTHTTVNIKSLSAGVYYIMMKSNKDAVVKKFVKL